MHVDFAWLGMVITARSQASASPCLADGHTGIRILSGMWWKRFVDPHNTRSATSHVFGDDHCDLWQPEPQYDLDGGRELNIKTELRCKRRSAPKLQPTLLP
jgi:hypothetical protein